MRHAGFLTILACLALPTAAAAQNPFGDVPNEPRPEEFMHWDAEAVDGFQSELDAALRNGEGIWDTPFVVATAMPRADHRPHDVQVIHRAGYTQPEIHAILHVPARSWHQVVVPEDESITYALINVFE